MEAISDNEGKIMLRSQIKMKCSKPESARNWEKRIKSTWNRKFMCIFKNKRYMWEPLEKLSVGNYKKYHKEFYDSNNSEPLLAVNYPIEIKNVNCNFAANTAKINGIYTPIPEEVKPKLLGLGGIQSLVLRPEYQIYKKEGDNELWLYPVLHASNTKIQWWIGTKENCCRPVRKAYGYAHSEKLNIGQPPFIANKKWWKYDGPPPVGAVIVAENLKWIEIDNFSLTLLSTKTNNEKNMENIICDQSNTLNSLKSHNNQLTSLIKEYYNSITPELRAKLFETNLKDMFKKSNICSICFSCNPITKCLHIDCVGCCKDCRNAAAAGGGGDGTCCACKKPQILQCPICLDEHTEQYLKILKCSHCVCWKCFCQSYEVHRPIEKCPTCRAVLN